MTTTPLAARLLAAPIPVFLRVVSQWGEDDRRRALYERCRQDRLTFFATYLPEEFDTPWSQLHRDLAEEHKVPWNLRLAQQRECTAAPRNHAKSTEMAFADVIHDVCYGFEVFVGIISTSFELSEQLVKDLHEVFTDPDSHPELHLIYGPFTVKGTQTDFRVMCPGNPWRDGVKIKAYSMRGTCRGHTAPKRKRFSKWILDDVVDPKTVNNPTIRDADERYIDDDVGESGSRYTIFRLLGTRLHTDDVVSRKLDDPRWNGRLYKALPQFPTERDGLWEQARQIWADLDLGDEAARVAAARAFYEANREAMDAGADVLWPDREEESLFACMVRFWANPASFFREKQNNPSAGSDQVFDVPAFKRCRWNPRTGEIITSSDRIVRIEDCKVAVWWDPIRYGKNEKKRDRAAFGVVARERTGRRYVLECHYVNAPTAKQRAFLWKLYDRLGAGNVTYHYENNIGTLHLDEGFKRERRERGANKATGQRSGMGLVLKEHNSQENKEKRLIRPQPDIANGFMEFATTLPQQLDDEYEQFPGSKHDDGMDAVERADWVLSRSQTVTFGSGSSKRRRGPGM